MTNSLIDTFTPAAALITFRKAIRLTTLSQELSPAANARNLANVFALAHCCFVSGQFRGFVGLPSKQHPLRALLFAYIAGHGGGSLADIILLGRCPQNLLSNIVFPFFAITFILMNYSPGDIVYRFYRLPFVFYTILLLEAGDFSGTVESRILAMEKLDPGKWWAILLAGAFPGFGGAFIRHLDVRLRGKKIHTGLDQNVTTGFLLSITYLATRYFSDQDTALLTLIGTVLSLALFEFAFRVKPVDSLHIAFDMDSDWSVIRNFFTTGSRESLVDDDAESEDDGDAPRTRRASRGRSRSRTPAIKREASTSKSAPTTRRRSTRAAAAK